MSPLDTPDAVISGSSTTYGRPLGIDGPGWLRSLIAKLRKRKLITQRFLVHVVYRDYRERYQVVHFDLSKVSLRKFVDGVLASEDVRSIEVAELLIKARKSFGADYDPSNWMAVLGLDKEQSNEGRNP